MTKIKDVKKDVIRTPRIAKEDRFLRDPEDGEFEKAGPLMDADARGIAMALSKLGKRTNTGVVLRWRPKWLRKHSVQPFSFYYFQDRLAVDFFNRDRKEMDALQEDLTQDQRAEISLKASLCHENGISYLHLGPDDELDMVSLGAKVGKTAYKKPGMSEGQD